MPPSDSPSLPVRRVTPASLQRYWRSNLRLTIVLLALWAFFGLGCGILFADFLADWNLPGTGYPLGFWFAQQGSIVAFVFIVLAYALLMNRLDKRHHVELSAEEVEAARQQAAADEEGAR